uniref:Uncharacterized protein n=1 Tax=Tanacetum cinerariifolium TaxID=118510 RepID=A0A6L2KKB9_TANCI|nr:hypothetical protein [Tanacetum cinerariifolium]
MMLHLLSRTVLQLPKETDEQPFIPPADFTTIGKFLNIVGYEGLVLRTTIFYVKNLTQPPDRHYSSQKHTVVQYPCYTKLSLTSRALGIPEELLTEDMKQTDAYKDYVVDIQGVEVPTMQPSEIEEDDENENDNDDHNDHALIRKKKTGSSEAPVQGFMESDAPMSDAPSQEAFVQKSNVRNLCIKIYELLKQVVPKLVTETTNIIFKDNLPWIIQEAVQKEKDRNKADVTSLTDPQSQVVDSDVWKALKEKYEKSSAPTDSCRHNAFRKRDHNDHPDDDFLLKGESIAKKQKTSRGSKSAKSSSSSKPTGNKPKTYSSQRQQEYDGWSTVQEINDDEDLSEEEIT